MSGIERELLRAELAEDCPALRGGKQPFNAATDPKPTFGFAESSHLKASGAAPTAPVPRASTLASTAVWRRP